MNVKEMRALDKDALQKELQYLLNTEFKLRMQQATQQLQNTNLQRPGQVDQLIVRHHPLPGLHPADGLLGQPQPVQLEPDCELLLAQPRPVCRSSSSAPRLSQR